MLRWFEKRLDSGPQNWKQYTVALLVFNTVLFVFGYRRAVAPALDAAESARSRACWRRRTIFQYRHLVHDQYRYSALFGRRGLLEFQPDLLLHSELLPLRRRSGFVRLTAIIRALPQRFGTSATSSSICGGWSFTCSCPSAFVHQPRVSGARHADDLSRATTRSSTLEPAAMGTDGQRPAEAADHRGRSAGRVCADEDAGDQRRRVLRDELGASVRESERG